MKWENITYYEIENAQNKNEYTEYQIIEALNITPKQYRELKNNKISKIEIKSQLDEIKTELLKIDIRNLTKYGERDYSPEEIKNICREYRVNITTFIKRIIGNNKNPLLTKRTLDSKDGKIYIGKQKQISNDLIQKIYLKKDKKIENLARMIAQMYGRSHNFEDLKQEAYLKIIECGGKIETNLSYDENLIINVLMKSLKYSMFNYLMKNKIEGSLIQINENGEFDLLDVIEDNTYNPDYLIETENSLRIEDITDEHREVYTTLKKYLDLMCYDRNKGLEKVSKHLNMTIEKLMQKLIEIQQIILDSELVKIDSKGRVILNEVY